MVEAYADKVTPVTRETPVAELLARLESAPDLHLIPVLDGQRLVGLIERGALLMRLAVTPAAPLTAEQLMDPEPVVVEADAAIEPLCDILLQGGDAAVTRGFVVTRRGRYVGVGTASSLLRALRAEASAAPTQAADASETAGLARQIHQAFRAPVQGLTAAVELLERQVEAGEVLEQIRAIGDQARELGDVVGDVAELSAPATPSASTAVPTPLRGLMDDVEARWTARTAGDGVTLLVGYEGDTELSADLDAARLHRLFDNLIGSAARYAREGMVEVRLKAQAMGQEVHVSAQVRDDAVRSDPGASDLFGDDLAGAVSRRLADRLGGRLRAENNAGRGSTVTFELEAPLSIPVEAPASNVESLVDLELGAAPHVLIVDDNATNRVVAQALVEMFGCSCETAEDGVEALEAVRARPFDLVLMDIKMPRMDGVQATRAIRALDGPERFTPIIALTANADPADAAAYMASGMAAVVEKPIKPERLRMAMNAALAAEPEADPVETSGRRSA
ncbi:response regulator [Brevundimonas sp. VNH65]|uniref:response regulator n=1 Tax=Brevundimonas sp. VNH65 TaxID=3400917 RepID=UPI003C044F87